MGPSLDQTRPLRRSMVYSLLRLSADAASLSHSSATLSQASLSSGLNAFLGVFAGLVGLFAETCGILFGHAKV